MKIILAVMLAFIPMMLNAQGENNIWAFSESSGGNPLVIDFNNSPTQIKFDFMLPTGHRNFSSAVCYPNGQLRFVVNLGEYAPWGPPDFNIVAANGTPVVGSNLRCNVMTEFSQPVVIPRPDSPDQYYIFYAYSGGILYCLLDMSLNSGNGAVVQRDLVLAPYGTVLAQKMVPVVGCDGVWLVARSRVLNGYYSFHITAEGVNTNAVVSAAGLFPEYDAMGFIKASPNGKLLALAGYRGLELYSFEKCSGKIKSLGIIDSTNNQLSYAQSIYNNYRFTDACFSPDGSKLYATFNGNHPDLTGFAADSGKLYQYDLNSLSIPAIRASKFLVMTNIRSIIGDLNACLADSPNPLGEMKYGPDGKLYIDNGSTTCRTPGTVPPGFNPGPGFHCLHFPNLAGLACGPELNVLDGSFPHYYGGDFYKGGTGGNSYLQREIVCAPPPADTIPGQIYNEAICFRDTGLLAADQAGECFVWEDSSESRIRRITSNGTYYVRYFKDCQVTTDTFRVSFISAPKVAARGSCPGMLTGQLVAIVPFAENTSFRFVWRSADGSILRQHEGNAGDTLSGLAPGNYTLTIIAGGACDTTIACEVEALPVPTIHASPGNTRIAYGDSIILLAEGAFIYVWSPSGSLDTATKQSPVARPLQPTVYTVVGFNEEGCTDTGYVSIDIDYTMPVLIPNAFSPNGDGLNDRFRVEGITHQKGMMVIYNRYGQEVYHSDDPSQGWDGTFSGIPCDGGTYYYLIELRYPDGKTKVCKGDLVLLR